MSKPASTRRNPARLDRRSVLLGSLLLLTGCEAGFQDPAAPTDPALEHRGPARDLSSLTYRAVDQLLFRTPQLTATVPVVVSSVTDSLRIDQSSRFGAIIADLVKSRLAQKHITVSEQRLRTAMLFKPGEGEMMLARDGRAVVPGPAYAYLLTGTYAVADARVYVALKLIAAKDAKIVSAVDFVVWVNKDINRLLQD